MPITLTGTRATATVVSYAGTTVTCSGTAFVSSHYNTQRVLALFTSAITFRGIAYVRTFVSGTQLRTEYGFFDPATNSEIVPVAGDIVQVSLNFQELIQAGLAVSGNQVTFTDSVTFGTVNNSLSLCLHDVNKNIDSNVGTMVGAGGVVVFGHLLSNEGTGKNNPCNIRFTATRADVMFQTQDNAFHGIFYGGSVIGDKSTNWFGGYLGAPAGTFLLDNVSFSPADVLSPGAGGNWATSPERHVLRNCNFYRDSTNGILVRWGNGVIQGGTYQISTAAPLSIFGSDTTGTYDIGSPPGERLIVSEVGTGSISKPALFRSNTAISITLNATNIITPKRSFSHSSNGSINNNATGIFRYTENYSRAAANTKIVINNSLGVLVDSGIADGVTPLSLTVEEARVTGVTETVTENNWDWGAYLYGKNFVGGSFATTTVTTIGGPAKDVAHGAILAQTNDLLIDNSDSVAVLGYAVIDDARQYYDYRAAFMYDNFDGTDKRIGRAGDAAELGSENLIIDATAATVYDDATKTIKSSVFTGGVNSSGTVALSNGATLNGGTFNTTVTTAESGLTFTDIAATKIVHTTAGAAVLTLNGGSVDEIEVTGGGDLIVNLNGGATVTTLTETNGTVTTFLNVIFTIQGYGLGSRICVINSTAGGVVYNGVPEAASLNLAPNSGVGFSDGDLLIVRSAAPGITGLTTAIARINDFTAVISEEIDPVYQALAINGATVTGYALDTVNSRIDVAGPTFDLHQAYASFWANSQTSAAGILDFFRAWTATDIASMALNSGVAPLLLNNLTGTDLTDTSGARLRRSDSVDPVLKPTTGGGALYFNFFSQVLTAETGVSGLTPSESDLLSQIVSVKVTTDKLDTTLEDAGTTFRFTTVALEQAPTGSGGTGGADAPAIYDYFTDLNRADAFKADTSTLATSAEIAALNDLSTTDLDTAVAGLATSAEIAALNDVSEASVYNYFTDLDRADAFKADVSGLSGGTGGADAPAIYNYFIEPGRPDVFRADTSALATSAQIAALNDLSTTDLDTAVAGLATSAEIAALNDLSSADLDTAVAGLATSAQVAAIDSASVADIAAEIERPGGLLDALPTLAEMEASTVLTNAAQTGNINDIVELIKKYHDNATVFLGQDGITKTTQSNAFSIITYDTDGVTILKTARFFDINGDPTNLANAVEYR